MNTADVKELYEEFVLPTYSKVPLCLVKGKGSRVWDLEGKEYLDFFPGWAVSGLGHCHPEVIHAIRHQVGKILHVPNNFYTPKQGQLAKEISKVSFPAHVFFCNSGAEATEAAIKFARKYGNETGRYEIVTMKQSFHGRTLAAVAATGQEKVQKGFEPLPTGFRYADFNHLDSVQNQLTDKTIAILLEPIQGEGGIHVATPDFMKGIRKLCDSRGLLLILDEVQTGIGRTGKMFAYQHYGIEPDLMTLAKSLGGGTPIGALVVSNRIQKEVLSPGTHAATYGGNPLVTAAALAVFRAIREKGLLKNAVLMGDYLGLKLRELKKRFPVVMEVRGVALMRALELSEAVTPYVDRAREKGLLINGTQEKVLRIMPAITVTKAEINRAIKILREVFTEVQVKG